MDAIKTDGSTNCIIDLLNLLHTSHPTHADGTSSLWCVSIREQDGLDGLQFFNLTMSQFTDEFDLHPFQHKIDRLSDSVIHIFENLSRDDVLFKLYPINNIVANRHICNTNYYFHGDEWKVWFD